MQLFSKFCAISWKDVHSVANEILDTLKKQDLDYFNHLKSSLGEKILPIDVYDFAYEILNKDPKKSTKLWKDLYKKKKKDWKERDLQPFGDPAIYLRKWISEAFAGIYGGQTLLFLWDFCFMHGWSKKIFYKIGLVTLMLIKVAFINHVDSKQPKNGRKVENGRKARNGLKPENGRTAENGGKA